MRRLADASSRTARGTRPSSARARPRWMPTSHRRLTSARPASSPWPRPRPRRRSRMITPRSVGGTSVGDPDVVVRRRHIPSSFDDDHEPNRTPAIGDVDDRMHGAGGRNRTDTLSPEPDFESGASTSSATPARRVGGSMPWAPAAVQTSRPRPGQTGATTVCSMAPNSDRRPGPRISIRTVSPAFRKGVLGAPPRRVSTARSSARQA